MTEQYKIPFYAKATIILAGAISVLFILYIGSDIIVPFIFSIFLAILVNPVVEFFVKIRCNRVLAILLSVLITLIVIAGLLVFVSSQLVAFSDSFPQFKEKFNDTLADAISWISQHSNLRTREINQWLTEQKTALGDKISASIGTAVMTIGEVLLLILIIPVYIFLILFYKPLFLEFIHRVFSNKDRKTVAEVLNGTNTIIRGYLRGLMFEVGIVTTLNSVGLLILGVDYAVLLGITGGLFNLIPYVGIFMATIMSVTVAFVTQSVTTALLVLLLYIIVQFIDNNILVPYVVASQVKINAVISIIAVIMGNMLWGVAGMFLSIPIIALVKIICDHIEELKPWGYLLGDEMKVPGNRRAVGIKTHQKKK